MRRLHAAAWLCLLAGCASVPPPVSPPHAGETAPVTAIATPSRTAGSLLPLPPAKPGQIPHLGGGYYLDDGPIMDVPYDLDALPEPVPRAEPLNRGANKPYTVMGQNFVPLTPGTAYREEGIASWYGRKFQGKATAIGETYDMFKLTAAHPTLPIPSYARVTNLANGRSIVVRINDRGPFKKGRVMDLSYAAAYRLGYNNLGSASVRVEALQAETGVAAIVADVPATGTDNDPIMSAVLAAEANPQPVATPQPLTHGSLWLQVAAFGSAQAAEAFRAHLNAELDGGAQAAVQVAGHLWRVRVGPYATRVAATQAANHFAAQYATQPMIVK